MSTYLITGVSSGLGAAVASALLNEEKNVIGISRRPNSELSRFNKYKSVILDIRHSKSVENEFKVLLDTFGRFDGIVHAAASGGPLGRIEDSSPTEWFDAINTNLVGTYNLISNAAREFRKAKRGNFVAISGGGATNPMPRMTAYAASKSGVVRLVESVARDFDDLKEVTFNSVAPGIMKTAMIDRVIDVGPEVVGQVYYDKIIDFKINGVDSKPKAVELVKYLVTRNNHEISGKLISAVWDEWQTLVENREYKSNFDLHTLRRTTHD